MASKVGVVMRQEFRMTAGNKAFVVITIIGPFLILAISVLPGLFAGGAAQGRSTTPVGIVTTDVDLYAEVSAALAPTHLAPERFAGLEDARAAIDRDAIRGALVLPEDINADSMTYYTENAAEIATQQILSDAVGRVLVSLRLSDAGLDPQRISALTNRPRLSIASVDPADEGSAGTDFFSVFALALTFVMLLYMTVLLYGQMIGRSVLNEKASKTVEIMLSSVHPRQLLFGKILGLGLAGLLQYAIWIGVGLILTYLVGPSVGFSPPAGLNAVNLVFLLIFFVVAFFLYATCYALLGAGSEDEQHLGQLAWPLIVLLIIPLVMVSALVMSPDSGVSVALSLVPFTGPIVMLMRIVVGSPPAWQIALSLALVIGTTGALTVVAARIFEVGILMTGRRFKLREILSWIGIRR